MRVRLRPQVGLSRNSFTHVAGIFIHGCKKVGLTCPHFCFWLEMMSSLSQLMTSAETALARKLTLIFIMTVPRLIGLLNLTEHI